jgi:hypothetical protein
MTVMATGTTVKTTKGWNLVYWVSTLFAALAFAGVGVANLVHIPKIAEGLLHLGYPAYFGMILGSWELLGSIAIVAPGLRRLKEWTYAGMFFTLTGAAISHAVAGDPVGHMLAPLTLLIAVMTSWGLQPARNGSCRHIATTQRGSIWLPGESTTGDGVVSSTLISFKSYPAGALCEQGGGFITGGSPSPKHHRMLSIINRLVLRCSGPSHCSPC